MKKRFSNATGNKNILEKEFRYKYFKDKDFEGYISFLRLVKVEKNWYVPRDNRESDCIQAKDYIWLSIYPIGKNYGITAMLNDKKEIVEWYFDITNSTGIENDIPYIEDLYLDIVITNKDELIILDEDELEEAYENNTITKEQYEIVIKQKEELIQKYSNKSEIVKLHDFTIKCLNMFDD